MPDSDIEALRLRAVEAAGRSLGVKFRAQGGRNIKALFQSQDGVRLCVLQSRLYPLAKKQGQKSYWYTLYQRGQQPFLRAGGDDAHLVLACEGLPHAYLFAYRVFLDLLDAPLTSNQYISIGENYRGHEGWHMHFETTDTPLIPLAPYELPLGPEGVREPPAEPFRPKPPAQGGGEADSTPAEGRGDEAKPPAQGRGRETEPPTAPTRGPRPDALGYSYSARYEPNQPAFTYLLRFANSTIWKVGWAHNVERRLKDINAHIPDELLAKVAGLRAPALWQAYTRQEWTTARQAYAMEQAILLALKAQGFATRRERAACSITDMMRVWNGERDKHLS